ncbi:ArdC family protein [Roseiconus lacunae]|uniref:ArdC family protein n=1 Tax=Roseiconus lacunae TaxID=2605694 RepID=UPI001E601EE2|nr:zincin-like metallopeptidase domain-containing protein [Roseiconus lacunae]MCD0459547.1 ssDNA-binding domain-containing protein [Roseiconus lacunae]
MRSQTDIRQDITNAIIECLKSNAALPPWRKTWSDDPNAPGLHTSLSTGAAYRGINQLILQCSALKQGFNSKWWGTYKQIQFSGASIRKGQKASKVILWKPIKRTRIDDSGRETDDSFLVMREFCLWNAEQTTALSQFRVGHTKPNGDEETRYEHADQVIEATGANINYGGNRAFYCLSDDTITMPFRHQFETPEACYETLLHELCHYSESRVGATRDDNNSYAFFELVAEIGSCFLMNELGMATTENLDNHAAYVKSWLNAMADDPKFIFRASAQASKAADYILSFSRNTEETSKANRPVLAQSTSG